MVDQTRDTTSQRSAFSSLDKGQAEFNIPPSVLPTKLTDGGTYIVIGTTRQGSEPKLWSTGDPEQAQHLFDQYTRQMETQG